MHTRNFTGNFPEYPSKLLSSTAYKRFCYGLGALYYAKPTVKALWSGQRKTRDWKTQDGQKDARLKNARLEKVRLNCRSGKCGMGKCGTKLQWWKIQEKDCVDSQMVLQPLLLQDQVSVRYADIVGRQAMPYFCLMSALLIGQQCRSPKWSSTLSATDSEGPCSTAVSLQYAIMLQIIKLTTTTAIISYI